MRLSIDVLLDYFLPAPADLLLAIEVAQTPDQRLLSDRLTAWGVGPMTPVGSEDGLGRRTWMRGEGRITARYVAQVDVERAAPSLAGVPAGIRHALPAGVIPYVFPSRYCAADAIEPFVAKTFGGLAGGDMVEAIAAWIHRHVDYVPGSTSVRKNATDTFLERKGVCRDFAHLFVAMCRAADIPARMVGAYAWQLIPEDFHAVAEVWLDGAWHLVDPTRLAPADGIVRIVAGRDATDVAFLTIFGTAQLIEQHVTVSLIE